MVSAEGMRVAPEARGLNPLSALDTCRPDPSPGGPPARAAARVLISRPEHFTQEATRMISDLREGLASQREVLPPVDFLLAPREVDSAAQAQTLGRACGALIVLWEPRHTKSLELTLPDPARVPLRELVQERLCEFGGHRDQLAILYLTIAGLLNMRDNQYDRAVLFMTSARSLDTHCLRLPGAGAGRPREE
jgi:hypothetical protein